MYVIICKNYNTGCPTWDSLFHGCLIKCSEVVVVVVAHGVALVELWVLRSEVAEARGSRAAGRSKEFGSATASATRNRRNNADATKKNSGVDKEDSHGTWFLYARSNIRR